MTRDDWREITTNDARYRIRKDGEFYDVQWYAETLHGWFPLNNPVAFDLCQYIYDAILSQEAA